MLDQPSLRLRRAEARRRHRAPASPAPAAPLPRCHSRLRRPTVLPNARSTLSSKSFFEQLQVVNAPPMRHRKDLLLAPVIVSGETMDSQQQALLRLPQVPDCERLQVEVKFTLLFTVRANYFQTEIDKRVAFLHRPIDQREGLVVKLRSFKR